MLLQPSTLQYRRLCFRNIVLFGVIVVHVTVLGSTDPPTAAAAVSSPLAPATTPGDMDLSSLIYLLTLSKFSKVIVSSMPITIEQWNVSWQKSNLDMKNLSQWEEVLSVLFHK